MIRLINIDEAVAQDNTAIDYKNLSIDLAYVLFTSGSTGTPKGVMIPHKAIIDYIDWCVETYQLTDQDVIANHAPLYFDNSTFDLYTAFKTGATLHLVHDELNSVIPLLVKWLRDREITTFFCVPSVLTLLLKSRRLKEDSFPKLRHVICAGEVLPTDVLIEWMQRYPHLQFTNMYGPTEITVDCSYHVIHNLPSDRRTAIPIGKARKNMAMFVRDANGILSTDVGAEGELLVRGTSVAYGYLGDSERSAKAFIQNPTHKLFHDPLYCTGDFVRIDENGDFLFLGRADDQIKFLGYRIELGEIEASLRSIAGVEESVVVFNNCDDESLRELGALISVATNFNLDLVRDHLKVRLPAYMIPSRLHLHISEFPRTPNGKYDRTAIKEILFPNEDC
jgi:amino acid adenylation domain-containing protein